MNPGSTNPKRPKKPKQDVIERLNQIIGRILGKKPNRSRPNLDSKTSNLTFIVLIVFSLLGLWSLSGFYYITDTQSALIMHSGKYQKTLHGPDAGFTFPYPFGNVIIVDTGVSDTLFIGRTNSADIGYLATSRDLVALSVNAEFSYQVVDPSKLFLNYLQKDNNVDTLMIQFVEQKMHTFIATNVAENLLNANLIVLSNQLRDKANEDLANYGIKLIKLNLSDLKLYTAVASSVTESATSKSEVITTDNPSNNHSKITAESDTLTIQLINRAENDQSVKDLRSLDRTVKRSRDLN